VEYEDARPETESGSYETPEPGPEPPEEPDPCGCGGDCDPGAIDDLACSAKRYEKQAEIIKASLEKVTKYRDDYATARTRYQEARDAAAADVAAVSDQLADVLKAVRCQLKDHQQECLDDGLDKVVACIRSCAGDTGCCVGTCTFDPEPGDDAAAALRGRIEQYRRDVERAEKCFTKVIAEITELPKRVTSLKDNVAALAEEAAGTGPKNWALLYARAIAAQWQLKPAQLYAGFDTVNDLVDCLCQALTCIMQGWEAIAVLEGIVAELDCKAEAAADACQKRQDDLVGEVMRHYDRCCKDKGTPPDPKPDDYDDGHPPKEPCGCEGHHHDGEQSQSAV
jgi:hypothetical protein